MKYKTTTVSSRFTFTAAVLALAALTLPSAAVASFLPPEMMDKAAMGLAWFVICVVPIGAIALFWLVHVLPAIHTLCLLSLAFGGLLWPLAWLWAYTKPAGYRLAYGTEKHDDYYHEQGEKAKAGELLEYELLHLKEELDAMAAKGTLTAELKLLRRDLATATAAPAALPTAQTTPVASAAAPRIPPASGRKGGGA